MIVGLMVGAPFATAIAAGIPQYGRSLEIVSMRAAVEDVGPINTNVHVTTSWTPLTAKDHLRTDEAVFSASDTHFGELVTGSVRLAKSRLNWWGWLGGPMRTDELASQSRFQYIERIDNHVGYVTGQAPTEATTIVDGVPVIEVAVYHERAELLQIKIGDVIDSQPIERGAGLVRALVTGTFQRNDPDEVFWMGFGDIFLAPAVDGREQPLIMFPTYDSMFTAVAEANAGLPGTFDWFLFTDPVFMGNMTMAELETALDNLALELEEPLTRPFVITEMIPRIESMKQRALFGSIPLLLLALLILACVAFYLTMAAGLLARRRIGGYMMLRSRGFSIRQQLGIHIIEAAIVTVPAAVVAPLVSYLLIASLGYLPTYSAITEGSVMPVTLAVSAWIWSFGAAGVVTVVITAASSFWDRSTLAESQSSDARPVTSPWFQRYYVDVLLVGLSLILWRELESRTGVVVAEREGDFTPDFSLLIAPVLIVVAGSLVALRVFPFAARLIAAAGARSNVTALGLGLANVARRPFFHGWPMLAFALSISTGIVAGSVVSTLERSTNEQVLYSTGADIHVTTSGSTGRVGPEQVSEIRDMEAVDMVSPALRTGSTVGTTSIGVRFTLLAVDPINFQRVAWFRDDFTDSDASITQLVDRLAVRVVPEPIELPPGTTEISLWAKSEPVLQNLELWVVVREGNGESRTLNLGRFQDGWFNGSARLRRIVEPVEITSIQTSLPVGPDSAPPMDVLIDDLVATTGDGARHIVIDFDEPELWTGLPTSEGEDTGFAITTEPPEISGFVEGDAGTGVARLSLGRGSSQGIRGIYRQAVERPIPIIASANFLSQTSVGLRRPFLIEVKGGLVPVEVIDSINYFPTLDPARGPFAVADIDAIIDFVELRGRAEVSPNELFASLVAPESPAAETSESIRDLFRIAHVDSRARRVNDTFVDPVAVAGWRGISVVATIVAAVIVLMAYAIFLAAYALHTKGDSALILALGASRRDYSVSMIAELSPAIVTGTLVGIGTGLAVSSLMVSSMAHTGTGERLVPPFLLETDWALPLVTIGAIFAIVVAGIASSVRSFKGIHIARIAREGFSASSS